MGTGAGLVVHMNDTRWGVVVPLPPEMDNTMAELLHPGSRDASGTSEHGQGRWYVTLKRRSPWWWGARIDSDPLWKAIQWSVTPSEAVHWWVRGHVQAPDNDEDYERRRQGNAWADEYAEVAARKSARGHRVALPLSLGAAYGSRRADGPGKMEWRIHKPGYWRPPRQMDS